MNLICSRSATTSVNSKTFLHHYVRKYLRTSIKYWFLIIYIFYWAGTIYILALQTTSNTNIKNMGRDQCSFNRCFLVERFELTTAFQIFIFIGTLRALRYALSSNIILYFIHINRLNLSANQYHSMCWRWPLFAGSPAPCSVTARLTALAIGGLEFGLPALYHKLY